MTLLLEEVYKLQVLDLDILSSSKLLSDIKYKISDKKDENSTKAKIYSYEIIGKQKQFFIASFN